MKRPLSLLALAVSAVCILISVNIRSSLDPHTEINGKNMKITGIVSDITFKIKDGVRKETLYIKNVDGSEGVIAYLSDSYYVPHIGAKICVKGTGVSFSRARNEGMFDSLTYYNTLNMNYGLYSASVVSESSSYDHLRDSLFRFKTKLCLLLDEALPEDDASIMKTMLLGVKSELDPEIKSLYQRNGIAHILSISGLHISILGMLLFKALKKTGLKHPAAAFISFLFVLTYVIMTGFSVSSLRALFMFFLSMLAVFLGRTYDIVTSVSVAAALLLLDNPLYFYHTGFIFSFGCILGITFIIPTLVSNDVSPNISHSSSHASANSVSPSMSPNVSQLRNPSRLRAFIAGNPKKKLSNFEKRILSALTMAVIGFPIYLATSFQFPVYSMFLNFLIIPVMSVLFPVGILLLIMLWFNLPLSTICCGFITGILTIFQKFAEFADDLPGHYYTPGMPSYLQIGVFIIIMIFLYRHRCHIRIFLKYTIAVMALIMLTVRVRCPFEVNMLDVGQGDSIFLRYSENRVNIPGISKEFNILIDGGSTTESEVGKYRIIPFLKYKGAATLDYVFMTHPDKDHTSGIIELMESGKTEGIKIKCIVLPDISESSRDEKYTELEEIALENGINIAYIKRGDVIKRDGISITCLSPIENYETDDINSASTVLYVKCLAFSSLFTGDCEGEAEDMLTDYLNENGYSESRLTLLKVAHHGSKNSTDEDFLNAVKPLNSIISAGKDNSYGHPHKETLVRLSEIGSDIFRTDESGEITVKTDGEKLKIQTYM